MVNGRNYLSGIGFKTTKGEYGYHQYLQGYTKIVLHGGSVIYPCDLKSDADVNCILIQIVNEKGKFEKSGFDYYADCLLKTAMNTECYLADFTIAETSSFFSGLFTKPKYSSICELYLRKKVTTQDDLDAFNRIQAGLEAAMQQEELQTQNLIQRLNPEPLNLIQPA